MLPHFLIHPGRLSRTLVLQIVLMFTAVALLMTFVELASEYRRDLKSIDARIDQLERTMLPSLIENLWVADRDRLRTQLDGIIQLPDFVLAEIRVDDRTLLRSGLPPRDDGVLKRFPLVRVYRDTPQQIGELVVAASYAGVFERTLSRLSFFLIANVLMSLVAALCILAIFYRLIGRHLERLERQISQAGDSQQLPALSLERDAPSGGDELSVLVDALNQMRLQIDRQQQEMRDQIRTIRESRNQIAATIAAIPDLLFEMGADGTYHEVYTRRPELLSAPREALLGKRVGDVLPAPAAASVMQTISEAISGGTSHGHLLQLDIANGGRWFELSAARKNSDADGEPRVVLLSRDVTKRRQVELELKHTASRMNEAQRIAQIGHWDLNLLTGKLHWSDEIFRMFEIDQHRFEATYEGFLNVIHPDDRPMVDEAYTRSLESRTPYEVVHRLRMTDGRIKWVRERCETEFLADLTPARSIGTVQDITEQVNAQEALRESQQRYQAVVAALAEGVVIFDGHGRITATNRAAVEILGLSEDQLTGLTSMDPSWRAVHLDGSPFPGEDHPGPVALRTGKPQPNVVHGIHRPDGSLIWISVSAVPIFKGGETAPQGAVASFSDITQLKDAEERLKGINESLERRVEMRTRLLRAAKEEAEQANRAKSLFLSSMSHELRTPLNAILGYAQVLEMSGQLPDRAAASIAEISAAGKHLLALVNDVLDLSRIEEGKSDMQIESVEVGSLLAEAWSQNTGAARQREVNLQGEGAGAGLYVAADRRRLLQVINNLLSNAIKYNHPYGVVLVSCGAPEAGRIRISVTDNGPGIASEKQSQVFEPFNRLGAEMGSVEGTGIGLVIARRLIEDMGGRIDFESTLGIGSSFWVELPQAASAAIHSIHAAA